MRKLYALTYWVIGSTHWRKRFTATIIESDLPIGDVMKVAKDKIDISSEYLTMRPEESYFYVLRIIPRTTKVDKDFLEKHPLNSEPYTGDLIDHNGKVFTGEEYRGFCYFPKVDNTFDGMMNSKR